MIIPDEARAVGSNKKLKTPFITFVSIFFVLMSLIAMFGFCVSINLDIEYEDIEPSKGQFLLFLTVAICLSIILIFGLIIIYGVTRKYRCKYTEVLLDSYSLYFKEKNGSGVKVDFQDIIGFDDKKEYVKVYYDLGSKNGLASRFRGTFGCLEIKYKTLDGIKTINIYVEDLRKTKNEISEAIAKYKGQTLSDTFCARGEKLETLSSGYYVMALVVLFGVMGIFAMLIAFHIEDAILFERDVDIGLLVAYSVLSLAGLPLFIMIMTTFHIHRHQPRYVILCDSEKHVFYFFKKNKYIEVPFNDVKSGKIRHVYERVDTGKYTEYKDFSTGRYVRQAIYTTVRKPEGVVTIKFTKNGMTKTYWTYVSHVDETGF